MTPAHRDDEDDDEIEKRSRRVAKRSREDEIEQDDDDDEDEDDPSDDIDYDEDLAEKFFLPGKKNYLQIFGTQAVGVLTKPKQFFAAMPPDGTKDAFLFLTIAAVAYSSAQGIAKLDVEAFILPLLTSLFFTSMGSYIVFFVLATVCKGEGTLVQTFRVLAFSKATLLFAWISLGPVPVGGILSLIYCAYLNVVGLTKVHKMKRAVVIAVVVFLTLAMMLFKKITGLS